MNEENTYRLRFGEVRPWVEGLLPDHTGSQRIGLAVLIWCILTAQSLVLARLARAFPPEEAGRYQNDKTAHKHMLKRLGRILDWAALGAARVGTPLARVAIGLAVQAALRDGTAIQTADGRLLLPLLVDYTTSTDRFAILHAASFGQGRALPVWLKAFCYGDFGKEGQPGSQNHLEEQFLDGLLAALPDLPEGWSYVWVLDRGFPRPPLLERLERYRREHRLHPEWAVRMPAGWKVSSKGQARWVREYRVGWGQRGGWAGVQVGGASPVRHAHQVKS